MCARRAVTLGEVMLVEYSNVVFPVATCPDILEPIRLPILALNHLPQILCTIMHLTRLVDARVLGTRRSTAEAVERSGQLGPARFPVATYPAERAY